MLEHFVTFLLIIFTIAWFTWGMVGTIFISNWGFSSIKSQIGIVLFCAPVIYGIWHIAGAVN